MRKEDFLNLVHEKKIVEKQFVLRKAIIDFFRNRSIFSECANSILYSILVPFRAIRTRKVCFLLSCNHRVVFTRIINYRLYTRIHSLVYLVCVSTSSNGIKCIAALIRKKEEKKIAFSSSSTYTKKARLWHVCTLFLTNTRLYSILILKKV